MPDAGSEVRIVRLRGGSSFGAWHRAIVTGAAVVLVAAIATGLATAAIPSAVTMKSICSSGKIVAKRPTVTQPLVHCTNSGATGGKGTAVINVHTGRIKITWSNNGTSVLSFTRQLRPRPNQCPTGTGLSGISGKVIGGAGTGLKRFPKGWKLTERLCINPTTFATTIYPATAVTIAPPTTTTSSTTTSSTTTSSTTTSSTTTSSTTTSSTTTTSTTTPCGPIATTLSEIYVGPTAEVWFVIEPTSEPPACATHPTGTLTYHLTGGFCAGFSGSGLLKDSHSTPVDYWGLDTGITQQLEQTLGCPPGLTASYSGDSVYTGFSI